jgi:hypothetical protein
MGTDPTPRMTESSGKRYLSEDGTPDRHVVLISNRHDGKISVGEKRKAAKKLFALLYHF